MLTTSKPELVTDALNRVECEKIPLKLDPHATQLGYGSGPDNTTDYAVKPNLVRSTGNRNVEIARGGEGHLNGAPMVHVRLHTLRQESPREVVYLQKVVRCVGGGCLEDRSQEDDEEQMLVGHG